MRHLVIFIDDLQQYLPSQRADPGMILQTILTTLSESVDCLVVVVTCRTEDTPKVQAAFNWLFVQLSVITVPTFNLEDQDSQKREIIAEFQREGRIHIEDWDGTLGSLVLGLSTKNSQYFKLAETHYSAVVILKAMKLLSKAFITRHIEKYVRQVCISIFGEDELLKDNVWRESLEKLILLQFLATDDSGENRVLVIRKDIYFEKVVTDYPLDILSNQIEEDFKALRKVLISLGDVNALISLGLAFLDKKQYQESLSTLDIALTLEPHNAVLWSNKGVTLRKLNRYEEALVALDHALALSDKNEGTWSNKGATLRKLNRYEEALVALDRALALSDKNEGTWFNKGLTLMALNRYEEVLVALDRALALNDKNEGTWFNKGLTLRKLNRYEEALVALDRALALNEKEPEILVQKGCLLENSWKTQGSSRTFESCPLP